MRNVQVAVVLSFLVFFLGAAFGGGGCSAQTNVTTWRNDNGRTGQNTSESTLTTSNVTEARFGKVCSAPVDGQIYAQPLVVWDSANSRNIVYVVTMNDNVYAFNGKTCAVIASNTQLIPTSEAPVDCHSIGGGGCVTIKPTVGILGTPVIDTNTSTIYLVTESQYPTTSPTTWYHRIHALNAVTLAEKSSAPYLSPQVISGQASSGLTFMSQTHIQRPGLLLLPTSGQSYSDVYIAFSLMDGDPSMPSGWIFAYNASNLAASGYPHVFATAPQQSPVQAVGGGLWMGAAGIAADANGIYVTSGDGTFDLSASGSDAADSFLKLTNDTLTISSYFTPSDQLWRSCFDQDLGSGGVTLPPSGPWGTYLAVNPDKRGALWVNDTTSLNGFHAGSCDQTACPTTHACAQASQDNRVVQTVWTTNYYHTSLAYWNSNLYVAGSNLGNSSSLVQYPMCGPGSCSCTTTQVICPGPYNSSGTSATFPWGASPSVSSTSTMTNGIVWAIYSDGSYLGGAKAILYAFNALGSGGSLTELYDSNQCFINHVQVDQAGGSSTKFSVPTIANGYVYIGTQTELDVYGEIAPINPRVCSSN